MEPEKIAALRKAIDRIDRSVQLMDNPIRISSFYRPQSVESSTQVLSTRAEVVKESLLEYDDATVDRLRAMAKKVHKNYKDIKELFEKHGEGLLRISKRHTIPTAPAKLREFEEMFTNIAKDGTYIYEPARGKLSRLRAMVSRLHPVDRYTVELVGPQMHDEMTEYKALFKKWGVEQDEKHTEYYMLSAILAEVLALIRDVALDKARHQGPAPNLRDSMSRKILTKNITSGYLDLIKGISEGRDISRITEIKVKTDKKFEQRLLSNGGFLIEGEDMTVVPKEAREAAMVGDTHKAARITAEQRVKAAIDSMSMLWQFTQDHPDYKDSISLKDLAKYDPEYQRQIDKRHYEALTKIFVGLREAEKIKVVHSSGKVMKKLSVDSDKETKMNKWDYIRVLEIKAVYTKAGEVPISDNLDQVPNNTPLMVDVAFSEEYLNLLKRYNLAVILNRLNEFSSVDNQILAIKLADEFARQQDDTTQGKEIEISMQELYDTMPPADKTNSTRRRAAMTNFFNEAKKLGRITNWRSSITNKTRVAYSGLPSDVANKKEKIYVFPGEDFVLGHITKEMRETYKIQSSIEKKNRRANLQKLLDIEDETGKRYSDFLKFVEEINEEMDSLGLKTAVSSQELLNMYSGKTMVTDEVNTAITSLLEPVDMSE